MRSRRRLQWTTGALLVAGLSLAACSGNSGSSAASPAASGASGSTTLKVTASEEMSDLNPFLASQQGKTEVLSAIAPPLLYYNGNNQITSQLLKSWTATDNDMTINLVLKPGMKWSDGQPITSADMLMSLTAYMDAPISTNAGRIGAVAGLDALAKDGSTPVSQVKIAGLTTPDKDTLQVKLATPDVAWLPQLALLSFWSLLPEHVLGKDTLSAIGKDPYFKTWPVSDGAFTLQKWVYGQYAEVQANPNWPGGKAGFQHVFFEIINSDQMQAQLQTGQIQYMYPVDPTQAATVKGIQGVTIQQHQGVAPDTLGLNYNSPALKDPRVRQAMIYAMNREQICKSVLAGYCTISTPNLREVAPAWSLPTTGVNEYAYDPAKAKALLAAAGWKPGTTLTFLTRTADAPAYVEQAMTIFQGEEAAVGINIKLENVSTAELLTEFPKKTGWDGFWVSGANFAADPSQMANYMECSQRYPAGANTSQFCDPAVDKLFTLGLTQANQSQRAATYQQAFTILNHNPSEIYLYNVDSIAAFDSRLQGPAPFGNNSSGYYDIGKWHWSASS
jgi:peptide/nickel transport system substrate-binding protein